MCTLSCSRYNICIYPNVGEEGGGGGGGFCAMPCLCISQLLPLMKKKHCIKVRKKSELHICMKFAFLN